MAARHALRAVLFDWDGTLVDSAAKSYRCYVRVFSAYGIDYDHAMFERTYSPDWYRTYQEIGLPREAWAEADARWLECYETEPSSLLPGAREALSRLAASGKLRGLVSSGDPSRVRREIVSLGVAGYFGAVVCGGETEERKPHPQPLLLALERLGVPPAEAAYVGDSPEDVLMARSAGVLAVGVPGGFPNRRALEEAAPQLFSTDLVSAVERLLG
ncbi:MAG TPA: HAD family hydrolase [Vicinamibacteria bacterium]|nr:HAD family hydrolase [Vicinamibacteria bacterium]